MSENINDQLTKAKKELFDLDKQIKFHNEQYHKYDKPLISDEEFDKLVRKANKIIETYPELNDGNLSFNKVGSEILENFSKIIHIYKLYSLSNVFDQEELEDFDKKCKNFLKIDHAQDLEYLIEPKFDGLSIVLNYENGNLLNAATRGNGSEGEDITHNIEHVPSIMHNIPYKDKVSIRGELFMRFESFDILNEMQEEQEKAKFKNPRNATAGIIRQLKPDITKLSHLDFYAFNIEGDHNCKSQIEKNLLLRKIGFNAKENLEKIGFDKITSLFKTNDFQKYPDIATNIKMAYKMIDQILSQKAKLGFAIDGAVIKLNDLALQQRLDVANNKPRYATAFKFPESELQTKIEDIIYQVGRTGIITPVAIVKEVFIDGSNVTRASLHNEDEINKLDLHKDDIIVIKKAGEIIPKIIAVDKSKRIQKSEKYQFITHCPSCGSKVEKETSAKNEGQIGKNTICPNHQNCPEQQIQYLCYFTSKNIFDINEMGNETIRLFYDLGYIKNHFDIFTLEKRNKEFENPIENIHGFSNHSVSLLFNAINQRRTIKLDLFIKSLGIRNIGEKNAKILAKYFKTIDIFSSAFLSLNCNLNQTEKIKSELINIDGISEVVVNNLFNYFSNEQNIVNVKKLLAEIIIENFEEEKFVNSPLTGKKIIFTGTLKSSSRQEAKIKSEKIGAIITSSLSSSTDYLVYGEKAGSKLAKADALKIKKLSEDEWLEIINKSNSTV